MSLYQFAMAMRIPRVRKAPGGRIIIIQGVNQSPMTVKPKILPDPRISRMVPSVTNTKINPSPIPKLSSKERPILFSTVNVQAILEGRKTQTRRLDWLRVTNKSPDSYRFAVLDAIGILG